ncbi:hypothetical protein AXE80_02180 [Wenyingzhuangia fucanilytica]|uniref:histidine kinase n=1 Tax=Wenyingzhuangia fucanilytica TaxID=1790137 RepID=A0A1B1Y311_9FLAO|nr:hybrid sensor histidine kinase/response regulator [Wenyingzhuangia fucanilytica]ANW95165.1 hypothetical protein AXE80_02180 [Wenyingzhuangia fucanilytica]
METLETKKPKILIVDDQQKNIQVLGSLLKAEHYIIGVAMDGEQAINTLSKSTDYDLILLDINMPVMNGYEACIQIKANDALKDIPIIFLTAMADKESILKGFEVGGQDYISKPFSSQELLSRVKTHLDLKISKDQLKDINNHLEEKVKARTKELEIAKLKLEKSNQELENLDAAKNDFLAIISHEINTPLNGILGFINVLKDELKTSELIEFVNLLDESANRLLSFSKLSLRITELRTKKNIFKKTPIQLKQVFGLTELKLSKKLQAKNINLKIDGNVDDLIINGDPALILYALENIIKNAIEYSEKSGDIIIKTETENKKTICSIIDEGKGFSEYALKHLFQLFASGKEHTDKKKGLGLALVKLIMEVHNAEINVINNPDKGATVSLIFNH